MTLENLEYNGDYIKGHFVKVSDSHGEIESRNPADLDLSPFTFPYHYDQIGEAVLAARRAFDSWRRMALSDRFSAVKSFRDELEKRKTDIASCITWEVGKPLWESLQDIDEALNDIDGFLETGCNTAKTEKVNLAYDSCEGSLNFYPYGVCAVITPAVQPVPSPLSYIIPALLDGNTVILKSSQHAPMTAQILAEIAHDAPLPAGVFNLLHGDSETARRLIAHKEIDGFFYTGAYEHAVKIQKQIHPHLWKVGIYNTGGKNGSVIWNDCAYEKALYENLYASYVSSGQRCYATSRILVHTDHFDRFVSDFHSLSKKCRIGDGTNSETPPLMGPLVSEAGLENYLRFQGMAVGEGCEEIMRGKPLERDKRGYFVSPSLHVVHNPSEKSHYETEDNSGPNVAFYRVQDLDEVATILNKTNYGLAAALYSGNPDNLKHLQQEVRAGHFNFNCPTTMVTRRLPMSGIKFSGNMRPLGATAASQLTFPMSTVQTQAQTTSSKLPGSVPTLERSS